MTDPRDDDALSWAGDDDPTRAAPASPARGGAAVTGSKRSSVSGPDGDAMLSGSAALDDADTPVTETAPTSMGNTALVGLGILGGVYGLFTIGWIVSGVRITPFATFLVTEAAYLPALWFAALAPAAWFAAAYLLTRDRPAWTRWAALIVGTLVLIPWPFAMLGVIGR